MYTLGNASVEGLRRLLDELEALPGGRSHVVVTDLREELVLYVNGIAYMRRELEMPAAALHHAGGQGAGLGKGAVGWRGSQGGLGMGRCLDESK